MITFDGPTNNGDGGVPDDVFDLIELPPDELDAAWQGFAKDHILPGRLFRLAVGLDVPTGEDQRHIEWCRACGDAYRRYTTPNESVTANNGHLRTDMRVGLRQKELWAADQPTHLSLPRLSSPPQNDGPGDVVPHLLRQYLHVDGPVVFGGNEVAFESWQFGRLLSSGDYAADLVEQINCVIVDAVKAYLPPRVDRDHLMIVCFGRAMHRCGVRIATALAECGFTPPHVVLAHDFYSPTLVCDDREFRKADVIVMVDVVHSGSTLDELMLLCQNKGARRVRGLALVDQSDRKPLSAEWFAIWREPKEQRLPLDAFVQTASDDQVRRLGRFEPNDEVALHVQQPAFPAASPVKTSRLSVDNALMQHIHDTGALKRDYMIGRKRYPYAVNVLDLIKKSDSAESAHHCKGGE